MNYHVTIRIGLLSLGIFFSLFSARAQKLEWAFAAGSAGFDIFSTLQTDSAGHVLAVGSFEGTADFDPGPGTANLSSGFAITYKINPVIAKYNSSGSFIWAKGLLGNATCYANKMVLDTDGNMYVIGTLNKGSIDFDPGPAQNLITSVSTGTAPEMYVCKLNSEGNLIWVKRIGNAFSRVVPMDLTLMPSGTLLIGGVFSTFGSPTTRVVNFNPAGAPAANFDPEGNDGFMLKLDTAGNYLSTTVIYSTAPNNDDDVLAVLSDLQENYYAAGQTIDAFGADSTRTPYTYLAKYSSSGSLVWVKKFSANIVVRKLKRDKSSSLVLGGIFTDTVDFDPDAGTSIRTTQGNTYDIFVARLSPNGSLSWVRQLPGTTDEELDALSLDEDHRIYISGSFNGNIDLHPDDTIFDISSSAGANDAFLLRLDSNGLYNQYRLKLGSAGNDAVAALLILKGGDLLASGKFSGSLDMDPAPAAQTTLTAVALSDMFLAKYNSCSVPDKAINTSTILQQTVCAGNPTTLSVSVPPGVNVFWYETAVLGQVLGTGNTINTPVITGNKSFFAEAVNSCGTSYDRVTIPIVPRANPDTTIIKTGSTLTVAESGSATYQWIDCANLLPVPSANGRTFSPAVSGSYAVQVTKNACTLSSSCVQVSVPNSADEIFQDNTLRLYPVPAAKELIIVFTKKMDAQQPVIELYNSLGQAYLIRQLNKDITSPFTLDIAELPAGLWHLVFDQDGERKLKSFVKK